MKHDSEPRDAREIRDLLDDWATAVRARDIDGVIRDRAADIHLYDVVPPLEVQGLAAYRATWTEQFFPWMGADGDFTLSAINIVSDTRVAFATGIIDCAGYEAGRRVAYRVRLTVGLEHRDGRWLVIHEHHSQPVDPQ